jgi:hypothetical protein
MDALTLFGLFAVSAMLLCYALEQRSHWFVLQFAGACCLGFAYGFLQGTWPFGLIEAIWAAIALRRWHKLRKIHVSHEERNRMTQRADRPAPAARAPTARRATGRPA